MRSRASLLLPLVLFSAGIAGAQSFDYKVANFQILQDKAIQKELGITEAQRTKMNASAKTYATVLNGLQQQAQKSGGKPNPEVQKKAQSALVTLRSGVLSALTTAQIKRLREITLQAAGKQALLDKTVAKEVGLNDSQYTKLVATFREGATKLEGLRKQGYDALAPKYKDKKPKTEAEGKALQAEFQKDLAAEMKKRGPAAKKIEADFDAKLKAIVPKSQWDKLEALRGKPFKPGK